MDTEITHLPDAALLARVKCLVQGEQHAIAALVAHLAEIDSRKLYLEEGCRSLFTYCTQVLHLSEYGAYNRIEAARTALRFPAVLQSLECGEVHLATVRLLASVLTPENHRDVLAAAKHKTKREIEQMVARLRPRPSVRAWARKLPSAKAEQSAVPEWVEPPGDAAPRIASSPAPAQHTNPESPPAARPPAVVVPLAPERFKVQFTANAATYDLLRQAQELLRHRIPNGDLAQVFDMALDLLVRELKRKKFAATDRPRQRVSPATPHSRHIPAEVKRVVWQRDEACCTFVGRNGSRCTERGQLEFDHVWPYGDGGSANADNVRLLCRRHNQHEARRFFGPWYAVGGTTM